MKSVSTQMTEDWARMPLPWLCHWFIGQDEKTHSSDSQEEGRAPHRHGIQLEISTSCQLLRLWIQCRNLARQGDSRERQGWPWPRNWVSSGFLKVCPLLLFHWCGNCASRMSTVAWIHKERERFCHLRRQSALSGTHDEYHPPKKDSMTPAEENRKDIKQKGSFLMMSPDIYLLQVVTAFVSTFLIRTHLILETVVVPVAWVFHKLLQFPRGVHVLSWELFINSW